MSLFEMLYDRTRELEKCSTYTENAVSPHGKHFSQEFDVGGEIGRGGYGFVRLCTDRQRISYAVKVVEKSSVVDWDVCERKGKESVLLESTVLASLHHINIIQLYEVYENTEYVLLVMEYVPWSTLYDVIEKLTSLTEDAARSIFRQVSDAVRYLHERGILHNDIKDENILVGAEGAVKLIDFGSSCYDTESFVRIYCGSETYASPEVVAGRRYIRRYQEIWSLGILLHVMLFGETPFSSYVDIEDGDPLTRVSSISKDAGDLLAGMLNRIPENRLTATQILNSQWIRQTSCSTFARFPAD